MADETCYSLDCCPPGTYVPPIGGVLSLAGDDTTGTDPNIAENQLLLLQEGYQILASTTSGSPNITVASYTGLPISGGQDVQVVGIYKTITITAGSPSFTLADTSGLTTGLYTISDYFSPTTTISSIVGTTVTMSSNALFSGTSVSVLFYGGSGTLPATIIPTSTTVSSVVGTAVTLSANATASTTNLLLNFSPATVDPNVVDGYDIYT